MDETEVLRVILLSFPYLGVIISPSIDCLLKLFKNVNLLSYHWLLYSIFFTHGSYGYLFFVKRVVLGLWVGLYDPYWSLPWPCLLLLGVEVTTSVNDRWSGMGGLFSFVCSWPTVWIFLLCNLFLILSTISETTTGTIQKDLEWLGLILTRGLGGVDFLFCRKILR